MSVLRHLTGYLKIRVTGSSPERFLNACSYRGICLWGIMPANGSYEMYITPTGFRKLRPIVRKTRMKVIIVGKYGLPFYLFHYRRRKVFLISAILGFGLIYMLSLFIWDIDLRGNTRYTDETLLAFLKEQSVVHGMKRSEVDCAEISREIRKEYNDIIWVSASIEGCRLILQIKENEDSREITEEETSGDDTEGTDIVADIGGTITSMIVRTGIPCVKEGDQVEPGDILVTGAVPVLNDSGEITGYQMQNSDADIRVRTTISYEDVQELDYDEKVIQGYGKKEFYLKWNQWMISLGTDHTDADLWDRSTEEHQLRLGDHFVLPVSWGIRTTRSYDIDKKVYTKDEIHENLKEALEYEIAVLEKKGVEIIGNDVKIYTGSACAEAKGDLEVVTDIGTSRMTDPNMIEQIDTVEEVPDGND